MAQMSIALLILINQDCHISTNITCVSASAYTRTMSSVPEGLQTKSQMTTIHSKNHQKDNVKDVRC